MRRYELTIITDGDISDDDRSSVLEKITGLISEHDGLLVAKDDWGTKKLAYPIKKKNRGAYVFIDYCGTGALVNEIERLLRIDDRVLKYMTVLLDDDIDPVLIMEEIRLKDAQKEVAKEAAEKSDKQEAGLEKTESEIEKSLSDIPESEEAESETTQTENKDKD